MIELIVIFGMALLLSGLPTFAVSMATFAFSSAGTRSSALAGSVAAIILIVGLWGFQLSQTRIADAGGLLFQLLFALVASTFGVFAGLLGFRRVLTAITERLVE